MTGVAYMPSRIFLSDSMPNDSVKSHRWFYLQQWEQWHNMCQWRINWFWLSGKQMCVICVKIVMSLLTWHVFIYLTTTHKRLSMFICQNAVADSEGGPGPPFGNAKKCKRAPLNRAGYCIGDGKILLLPPPTESRRLSETTEKFCYYPPHWIASTWHFTRKGPPP